LIKEFYDLDHLSASPHSIDKKLKRPKFDMQLQFRLNFARGILVDVQKISWLNADFGKRGRGVFGAMRNREYVEPTTKQERRWLTVQHALKRYRAVTLSQPVSNMLQVRLASEVAFGIE